MGFPFTGHRIKFPLLPASIPKLSDILNSKVPPYEFWFIKAVKQESYHIRYTPSMCRTY